LDAFTKHPEEVAGQWDVLVNELDLSHILPDRKMFVAVGEHKVILDKTELLAQSPESAKDGPQGLPVTEVEAPEMSSEQIKQLKTILDQFAKEKQELLDAMKSKQAGEIEFQQLVNLLQHTDIAKAEEAVRQSGEMSPAAEEAPPPPKDKYDEVLPDRDIVDLAEQDLSRIFGDLNSEDTETRAKAAAWLTKQEPTRVAEAGLKAVASDIPLKARRLVASVIQKAGEAAVDAFLEQINPNAPGFPLLKLITIADTFIDNPKLLPILRGIALTGPTETVRPTIEVLDQIPGKEVNMILLEVFNLAAGKVKMDILNVFAKRRVIEAVPMLLEIIKPKKTWEPEGRISLQEGICRALGEISSPEAADTLIAVATVPKPWALLKAKPDSVREAATLALRQLPDKVKIRKALDVLKSDKSPQVRKAARQ
jgi:HEAT repeat protein